MRPRQRLGAVVTALILGAYVAQKLQRPVGLQDRDDAALFILFSVAIMTTIYVLVSVAVKTRGRRQSRASGRSTADE
jgi:hypothetical protein